jgi:hypothetical protein
MRLRRFAPFPLVLLLGCGETRQEVIDRYRPRMYEMRQKLAALHQKLPEEMMPIARELDPKPEYDENAATGNTDFLAEEKLLDIDAAPPFDLGLSRILEVCLVWTGPSNPMSASTLRERNASYAADFESALATRYLIVLRSRAEGIAVQGGIFTGGAAAIEAFVVDFATDEVVAAARVDAFPGDRVSYSLRPGENEDMEARNAVHSSTWSNLRSPLAEALAKATGGSFHFRYQ